MAMKILDLVTTVPFESPRDPDKGTPKASKFLLGAIPSRVYTFLKDNATNYRQQSKDGGESLSLEFMTQQYNRNLVAFGLKGFENYDTEWETQKERIGSALYERVSDKIMDAMELELIAEIAGRVSELCEVNGQDAKNSAG